MRKATKKQTEFLKKLQKLLYHLSDMGIDVIRANDDYDKLEVRDAIGEVEWIVLTGHYDDNERGILNALREYYIRRTGENEKQKRETN